MTCSNFVVMVLRNRPPASTMANGHLRRQIVIEVGRDDGEGLARVAFPPPIFFQNQFSDFGRLCEVQAFRAVAVAKLLTGAPTRVGFSGNFPVSPLRYSPQAVDLRTAKVRISALRAPVRGALGCDSGWEVAYPAGSFRLKFSIRSDMAADPASRT